MRLYRETPVRAGYQEDLSVKIPRIPLTQEELRFLDGLRLKISGDYNSKNEPELWNVVKSFFAWGLVRHKAEPPYPSIGMVQESLRNLKGQESMGGFTVENGLKPVFYIALYHPAHLQDPAQLPMSIFHEIQHYLDWKKDPSNYERQKSLPPTHPIEVQHETTAATDLAAFVRESVEKRKQRNQI